ncbi:MAG: N-methylhydantoinase A/oxoprolinase/acetone carboxylase beta subunit [Paracoccaceae bacterium]|jgi:N-methylhydantoinase A/oxoprolinase/acetone carboxylase beta subunit
MKIGIDVGGTHTDAVVMRGLEILATHKALTSSDIKQGIVEALDAVMSTANLDAADITAVMIGTTHFTNAVIERKELSQTAIIRACLPTGSGIPPMCDWPEDIARCLGNHFYMIKGGHTFDGSEIHSLDDKEINIVLDDLVSKGIESIAIASAFSPTDNSHELHIAELVRAQIPGANITLSHEIGRLGILERENAALLNAALGGLAQSVVSNMKLALVERKMNCPFYVSQNDGTLMSADFIARYPALTFASGPTNSLRGAAVLSKLENAIVVDIGGTTSDIGVLANGFPRESNSFIDVGGVRTNFRMPDIMAIGLGGGSLVSSDGKVIGPSSVGHRLVKEGLVFGGPQLTATDIVVASGYQQIGDTSRVSGLSESLVNTASATIHRMIDEAIDKMRPSDKPVPVILVGGGSILITDKLTTASQVYCPEHAEVANAIGAAIAQVGGEVESVVSYSKVKRDEAIQAATQAARHKAIKAGAQEQSLRVLDIEETPLSYMDDNAVRLRVKVVGDLKQVSYS